MTEPKPEYKAGNEPPNLRAVECCGNCKYYHVSYEGDGWCNMTVHKFDVCACQLCDDYEPDGE